MTPTDPRYLHPTPGEIDDIEARDGVDLGVANATAEDFYSHLRSQADRGPYAATAAVALRLLEARDTEIATLRAEVEALRATVERVREVRDMHRRLARGGAQPGPDEHPRGAAMVRAWAASLQATADALTDALRPAPTSGETPPASPSGAGAPGAPTLEAAVELLRRVIHNGAGPISLRADTIAFLARHDAFLARNDAATGGDRG